MLSIQCILFYIPRLVWQMLAKDRMGLDVEHIIVETCNAPYIKKEHDREEAIDYLGNCLIQVVQKDYKKRSWRKQVLHLSCFTERIGAGLLIVYLFIKFLYLFNAIGRLFIMHHFLKMGTNYTFFGTKLLADILAGDDWEVTKIFPRVTYCQVPIRNLIQTNTIVSQCALPVNMLNEKMYIFLWFWIVGVAIFASGNILSWIIHVSIQSSRIHFIKSLLKHANVQVEKSILQDFVLNYLKYDGIFILKMISINAGSIMTIKMTEIVH